MKAELRKRQGRYFLVFENGTLYQGSLSLKNCQAIERGYDLDELAQSWSERIYEEISDSANILDSEEIFIADTPAFKAGFQKALEILGDRRFTERDLDKAIDWGLDSGRSGDVTHYAIDEFIQSLQQNEWDVEVETVPALSNNGNVYYGDIPKLDADGCLILKRVV